MKKYISLIAILALLVACMVPAVSAAGLEVTIDSKTVEMGEGTVEVVLEVKTGEKGIAGGQFDGLTVSEGATIKAVTPVGVVAPYNPANGNVAFFNAMGTDVNGVLFTITVVVPVDAPATFTVEFTGATNAKGAETAEEACNVVAGVITVAHECKPAEAVKENEKAPTCTEKGSYDLVVYCSLCKKELSRETITVDALGHKPGEWEVVAEATCVADGKKVQKCSVCGEVVAEEVLKALGHDLIVSKAPEKYDCDTGYLQTTTCSRCDLKEEKTITHEHAIHEYTTETKEEEKDGKVVTFAHKVEKCAHGVEGKDGYHGCSYEKDLGWVEIGDRPVTGDITPYIAMGVLTMVALISAAAYMLLKRKAI